MKTVEWSLYFERNKHLTLYILARTAISVFRSGSTINLFIGAVGSPQGGLICGAIFRLSSVVERLAVNEDVAGSSPAAGANVLMFKRLLN